jgi:cytochrome c peroxidase
MSKLLIILSCFVLFACSKDSILEDQVIVRPEIPSGFPKLPDSPGNQLTAARIKLGKRLFFEKLLSNDNSISCASCHFQQLAFSDPSPVSLGIQGQIGFRNAQPLFNLGFKEHFFRDGGVNNLRLSSLNPINNPNEMGSDIVSVIKRLKSSGRYTDDFQLAYQDTISALSILNALECFQRILISGNSKFDQWKRGETELNASEELGRNLFYSDRTHCSSCHGGFNFSSNDFKSNGLFETYADSGRQRITTLASDRGKFAIPSLRNISVTAPYMHNGSIETLEEVLSLYNEGGTNFENKDEVIQPLNLTDTEIAALLDFLLTLKDDSFLNNPGYKQ